MARTDPLQSRLFAPSGSATFSPCGLYRYTLTRDLGPGRLGTCNFCMLNPSTADAERSDPTVTRAMGFARTWGYSRLVVTNLFAYRSTDPRPLYKRDDPVGPENDSTIVGQAREAGLVVCAWGVHGALRGRGDFVRGLLVDAGVRLHVLRLTKGGHPGHPLYLAATALPARWTASWTR